MRRSVGGAGGVPARRLAAACLTRLQRRPLYRRLAALLPLRVTVHEADAAEAAAVRAIMRRDGAAPVFGSRSQDTEYVARAGGLLAGHALLVRNPADSPFWPGYWINDVFVRAPFRRRGVAQLLMRHVMLAATREGAGEVFLLVNAENVAALALYARLGFTRYSTPAVDGTLARQNERYGVTRVALRAALPPQAS